MANSKITEGQWEGLKLIYGYYCNIDQRKLKYKNFDEVGSKSWNMDLHDFMTFCRDFDIISTRKKKTKTQAQGNMQANKQNGQKIESKAQVNMIEKKRNSKLQGKKQDKWPIPEIIQAEAQVKITGSIQTNGKIGVQLKNKQGLAQSNKQNRGLRKQPLQYVSEKNLAKLFKKYSNSQAQITFQQFIKIFTQIAEAMFTPVQSEKVTAKSTKKDLKTQPSSEQLEKQPKDSKQSKQYLLSFLNLSSKQSCLQIYRHINQLHGTLDHLALLRSPVKKVNVKNNPLGKYSNPDLQGAQGQDYKKTKLKQSTRLSLPTLSKIKAPPRRNQTYKYALKYSKVQNFMDFNRVKISQMNSQYLQSTVPVNFQPSPQTSRLKILIANTQMANSKISTNGNHLSSLVQNRQKKYSQRHQDKVIKDPAHRQFVKYIDFSSIYQDQIFNQYIDLNYKKEQLYNS